MDYIGRFAPSPTGLLHIGSLLTAVASYADARSHGGKWLLRMEDLDPPREMTGAADHILHTLEQFGFEWDDEVAYQSQRHHLYRAALDELIENNHVYPCTCSRKMWQSQARVGVDGLVYNGACSQKIFSGCLKIKMWHGAFAFPIKSLNLKMKLWVVTRKISRKTLAILCCAARTVFGRINWRWWLMIFIKGLRILCVGRICWFPRRAKFICKAA